MRAGKEGGEGKVYVDIGNRDPGESGKVLERRKGMKGIGERERKKTRMVLVLEKRKEEGH